MGQELGYVACKVGEGCFRWVFFGAFTTSNRELWACEGCGLRLFVLVPRTWLCIMLIPSGFCATSAMTTSEMRGVVAAYMDPATNMMARTPT